MLRGKYGLSVRKYWILAKLTLLFRNDNASEAMAERVNRKRKMSSEGLAQRERAWKPDFLVKFSYTELKNPYVFVAKSRSVDMQHIHSVEYTCSEHGGNDEATDSTKKLFTSLLKAPKLLKDTLNHPGPKS